MLVAGPRTGLSPVVNRSGRIGRDGEHKANAYLALAGFLNVEREGKRAPSLDNLAEDLTTPVETKRRATLAIPAWTRQLRDRHASRWGLFVIARDARKKDSHPDLMVFPAEFGAKLLYVFEEVERKATRDE
jgi:hypothetical protein